MKTNYAKIWSCKIFNSNKYGVFARNKETGEIRKLKEFNNEFDAWNYAYKLNLKYGLNN